MADGEDGPAKASIAWTSIGDWSRGGAYLFAGMINVTCVKREQKGKRKKKLWIL